MNKVPKKAGGKPAARTYLAILHVTRNGELQQLQQTVQIALSRREELEYEFEVNGVRHTVHLILYGGRSRKLPAPDSRVGISIPSLDQTFWADLERSGDSSVSGRFRHFTGKDAKGRSLAGRWVGGYTFQLRPAT